MSGVSACKIVHYADFVILVSVFTHMLPDDAQHYLNEIARVLRPGGQMFASFFLQSPHHGTNVGYGKSTMQFPYHHGPCTSTDPTIPERAICYPESLARSLVAASGLAVQEPLLFGSWSGRPAFLSFQDILMASKGSPP